MKQLLYVLRSIANAKVNSFIKIISLTLGLAVAIVLFSKVAFEISYDKFYPDADRLYRLQRIIMMEGDAAYDGPVINYPVPGAMKDDLSEVEDVVVLQNYMAEKYLVKDDIQYKEKLLVADSTFFDMFGMELIEGDKKMLGVASNLFLSQSAAKRIFGNVSPVGQTIIFKDNQSTNTVAGVFKDMPDNSHLDFDAVLSLRTYSQHWNVDPVWWIGRDMFLGYVKLRPGADPKEVEAKLPDMLKKYMDVEKFLGQGAEFSYFLNPVKEIHSGADDMKRMILILSLLAFALLFVSAMNYVLISISSLASRAKAIGVHKCNGATNETIFSMFIRETSVQIVISLILSILLLLVFRGQIEGLLENSFTSIFSLSNLWVTLAVIIALILLAGIIPASIFSAIPVTQVFRVKTASKRTWKQALLFIQFAGIAFVVSLLLIIVKQYNMLINKDLGYTTENIMVTRSTDGMTGEQLNLVRDKLQQMPQVQSVSISEYLPIYGGNGWMIRNEETDEMLFSSRAIDVTPDYLETFDIQLIAGREFPENMTEGYNGVLINETFAKMMHWNDSPIGKTITESRKWEVIGVVKDYQLGSLYETKSGIFKGIQPLVIVGKTPPYSGWNHLIVRMNALDIDLQAEMTRMLRETLDNNEAFFAEYKSLLNEEYQSAKLFRNSILVASLLMLFITLLGLIGYTADEISRRSKEIAIRKITGATGANILRIISKDIMIISLPAIVIGIMISYLTGVQWLQQFAVKIPLNVFLFLTSGIFVVLLILACVTLRTVRVANSNPVESIKAE